MLLPRDLPKYETILQLATRYPQIDPRAVESFVTLLRVATDTLNAFGAYLTHKGISQGRFTVLMVLNRNPGEGLSPSELADKCGVTRATMTGLLDGLERDRLIRRENVSDDRRRARVRLTPGALKLLDRILPDYFRVVAELMGELDDAEKAQLVKLLRHVRSGISKALPEQDLQLNGG